MIHEAGIETISMPTLDQYQDQQPSPASLPNTYTHTSAPPPTPSRQKLRGSCDRCQETKLKCSRDRPTCSRCAQHKIQCVYSACRRVGRPRKSVSIQNNASAAGNASSDPSRNPPPSSVSSTPPSPSPSSTIQDNMTSANSQPFQFENDKNTEEWRLNAHDLSSPTNFMLDSFEWLNTDLTQPDGFQNAFSLNAPLPKDLESLQITDFSARGLSNKGFTKRYQNSQTPTELSTPALSSRNGSSTLLTDLDVMMPDVNQTPAQMISMTSPDPSQLLSFSRRMPSTCQNDCIELIARQIAVMSSQAAKKMTIDVMLALEKAIIPVRQAVCSCSTCFDNYVVMLLLSMLIEQTVTLFESLSDCRHLCSNEPFDSAHIMNIEWSLKKSGVESRLGSEITSKSTLLLGQYEVDRIDKSDFLKKVLRFRLKRTTNLLLELQERVNTSPIMDCNALAARMIAENACRRTEVLRGMLEMWE